MAKPQQQRPASRREERKDDRPQKGRRTMPTLEELEDGLRIDPNDLQGANVHQPELFYHAAKALAHAISVRDAAAQRVKEVEAEEDQKIRQRTHPDDKVTETDIKSQVRISRPMTRAIEEQQAAAAAVLRWDAIKEAYNKRSFALRDLVAMSLAEYYGAGSSESSGAREARDRRGEDARQAMNEERRRQYGASGSPRDRNRSED